MGDCESEALPVVSGVVQCSILCQNFFNAYISSVLQLELSDCTRLIAYADDLFIVKPISAAGDEALLQQDLEAIVQKYSALHLEITPQKSNYPICSSRLILEQRLSSS